MKTKLKRPSDRKLIAVLLAIIAIQTVVLWGLGQKVNNLWYDIMGRGTPQQQLNNGLSGFPIKVYTQSAIKNLYTDYGVVDPKENRVYFPEMRFYLPLSQQARNLRYNFQAGDNSKPYSPTPDVAQFNSVTVLNKLMQSFDDVGCIQRVVTVSVDNILKDNNMAVEKISIGNAGAEHVLYIYRNTNPNCKTVWNGDLSTQVSNLLKQSKSY